MEVKIRRREMDDFPEPILQHILSFLDFTNVIRASAVSRAWRGAVSTLQCLNVSYYCFPVNRTLAMVGKNSEKERLRLMLVSAGCFVMKAKKQNVQLHKLSFRLSGEFSYLVPFFMQCVDLNGTENISEFVFVVTNDLSVLDCTLPVSVYSAPSLQKLDVGGLNLSLAAPAGISLPSLRELRLSSNRIDEEHLEQLISNCPLLEFIEIVGCYGFRAFKVLGYLQKLKQIYLLNHFQKNGCREIQNIEIKGAPSIEIFHYRSQRYEILEILDVAACKNLKVLKLINLSGDDELLTSIEQTVSNLNHLQVFSLQDFTCLYAYEGLRRFRISSYSLRVLKLAFIEDPLDVQVNASQLSKIFYMGLISSKLSFGTSSIKVAKFVKSHCDTMTHDKLVEFLKNFNHIGAMKLVDFELDDLAIPEHLRNSLDPPLWDIKHLTVGTHSFGDIKYIPISMDVMDGLLWMAPQLDTLSFIVDSDLKSGITFQFIHGNTENNVEGNPFKPQRVTLIKVKAKSRPDYAEGLDLKMYRFNCKKLLEGNAIWDLHVISKSRGVCAGPLQVEQSKLKG